MFGLAAGLPTGLTPGLLAGLLTGLVFGTADNSPQATKPQEVIRADGSYGLVVGLAAGLVAGFAAALTAGLVFGFASAVVVGLVVGLVAGLAFGAKSWTRYHVAVVIIVARQRGPLRFAAFLDWAHKAGLLRVSGTAYQFRHRQLQDWLTAAPRPAGCAHQGHPLRGPGAADEFGHGSVDRQLPA